MNRRTASIKSSGEGNVSSSHERSGHEREESHAPRRRDNSAASQSVGNLAMQRLLRAKPNLDVSRPFDSEERDAHHAADRISSGESETSPNLPVKRRALSSAPPIIREALQSSGVPLEDRDRESMENFFDADLSGVRIHTGEQADASARALNALAYTAGNEIVFRDGQYSPDAATGKKLLAHELAHVAHDADKAVLHRDKDPAKEDPNMLPPGSVEVPEASEVGSVDYKYPWQYENVRTSIYQHREESLTEFLRIYAKIELDRGLMPVKDVTAAEIQAERERVKKELDETNELLKADLKNEPLKMKWIRLDKDVKYLERLPKGNLPTNASALEEVKKKWTAYLYSKKDDSGKDLEHEGLLRRVVERFDADTSFTRYPKWLRYMVIHFSGLRYEGAHGSYAPVTDLVKRLKTEEVKQRVAGASEKEIGKLVIDAETELEAESKKKPSGARAATIKSRLADLGGVETTIKKQFAGKGEENKLRAFEELMDLEAAREKVRMIGDVAFEEELDDQIAALIKTIGGPRVASAKRQVDEAKKRQQQALVVHEIERAQKALATLDDSQAIAMLKKMRTEGAFPDWFWLEVVKATALRLEAEGTAWTKPKMSYGEAAALRKQGPVTRQWMAILEKWQAEATAWRTKHGKDLSLVVSRAVCNEIAEQSQHARGVSPAGGIGQKATWYQSGTTGGRSFSLPSATTVVRGASLFWAKWSDTPPTDNVHKVRSNLFPILRTDDGQPISNGATDAAGHVYSVGPDNLVMRTEIIGTSGVAGTPPPTKIQWLVWYHEATVADVVGDRVLTFETGPIGLHDRWSLSDLVTKMNVYVGFTPEGPEPKDVDKYLKDIK